MSNYRSNQLQRFAGVFSALSNPNRLHIFLRLVSCCAPGTACSADEGHACVGEIGRDLRIAPSTVSHHIKELHRAGLIQTQRRGQNVDCWVDPETLREIAEFFAGALGEAVECPTEIGERNG